MKRVFSLLALAVAVLVVVSPALRAEIIEQVLVKVNGDIITKTDFEQRQIVYLRQNNRTEVLNDDEALRRVLTEITPLLIVDAVDELLLLQRGRELGYRMSDEQFTEIIQNIKKENKIESDEQFQAALKQENMTMADLRKALEKQMLVSRVQQTEVFGKVSVTEDEERDYFREHSSEFEKPARITLREILISVPGATADGRAVEPGAGVAVSVGVDDEAKEKAETLRRQVLAGEDFAKVAGEASDAPSKSDGGLIGPLDVTEMNPDLQKIVLALKVGDVGPIVRTPRGYQFVKLEARTDAGAPAFEELRTQIGQRIVQDRRKAEYEKYLNRLRAQAIVEWKNDELKKAYDQRVAELLQAVPAT